jgi:predicted DNA-binding transcriptional regulator AlpA
MTRFLSKKNITEMTGLSRATIDRYRRAGAFPEPLQLTPRRVAWTEESIRHWCASLRLASVKGSDHD